MLRACGFSPSDEQVRQFLSPQQQQQSGDDQANAGDANQLKSSSDEKLTNAAAAVADPSGSGKVTFSEFLEVCRAMPRPVDEKDELLSAFRVFDKHGTGKLMVEDFRQIMTTMGEKLSDGEFEELMKLATVDTDGEFDYHDLVDTLVEGIH